MTLFSDSQMRRHLEQENTRLKIQNEALREKLAFAYFCGEWDFDCVNYLNKEGKINHIKMMHRRWLDHVAEIKHSGDCTNEPWACIRCIVEACYETAGIITEI